MSAHELATLVRQLRISIGRHARGGAWSTSGASHAPLAAPSGHAYLQNADDTHVVPSAPLAPVQSLLAIRHDLGDCQRCGLCTERNQIVFGNGASDAPLMFIGEGPGADEDRAGDPFVGRAGELLDKMIVAMGWQRQQVYVTNVVKCRPPNNRTPQPDEVLACSPFLQAQIAAVRPRIIVGLGRPAANYLLGNNTPISSVRGQFFARDFVGHRVQVMPTFHPAFLLRQPERKRDAWADLKLVMAELSRLQIAPR